MAWLTLERTFAEHLPTTLAACGLWLASLAARVWRAPADVTALVAWVALFTAPPFAWRSARIRAATQMAVDETRVRFAYLLDDRGGSSRACASRGAPPARRRTRGIGGDDKPWTGVERGARARRGVERRRAQKRRRDHHRAAGQPGDGRGVRRARGGGGGEVAADVSAAEEGNHARAPGGAEPPRRGGVGAARGRVSSVVRSAISALRNGPTRASSPTTSEDSPSPPRADATRNARADETNRRGSTRPLSLGLSATVTTRRYARRRA